MSLKESYGNRKAFEWFVREKDEWYWERTKRRVEEAERKMAALVVASTAISLLAAALISRIYKS